MKKLLIYLGTLAEFLATTLQKIVRVGIDSTRNTHQPIIQLSKLKINVQHFKEKTQRKTKAIINQ